MTKQIIIGVLDGWLFYGVIMSIVWGFYGATMYPPSGENLKTFRVKLMLFAMRCYQFVHNFVCCLAGWVALHFLYKYYYLEGMKFDLAGLILSSIAVFGLTGHLAGVVYKTTKAMERLVSLKLS